MEIMLDRWFVLLLLCLVALIYGSWACCSSWLRPQPALPPRCVAAKRNSALYYQSGWCPGEACGPGGESEAQARTGKGPRCTTYAVLLRVSSARSDTPIPHRLPGFKHPLTDVGPSLLDSDLLVRTPLRRREQKLIGRPQRAVGMRRGEDRRGRGPTTLWHRSSAPTCPEMPEAPRR